MTCRACRQSHLFKFLDLGETPPADDFRRADQLHEPDTYFPLQVFMCADCGLAQLGHVVPPEILYRRDYPYEASTTAAGRAHWARLAQEIVGRLSLAPGSLVVDIGSNVGVLLGGFRDAGMRVQGVDPAPNIVDIARSNGIETICDFFGVDVADQIVRNYGRASVITGTNVFAHIDDLHAFMRGIDRLLAPDGVLILEAPYLANLVAYTEYDTVYHEHLSYLSVRPLVPFFDNCNMEVFDIEQVEIHGGSLRVFAGRRGRHEVTSEVSRLLAQEAETQLHAPKTLHAFARAVEQNRRELVWLLHCLKADGKKIAGISAPAKGMTLLNYGGIDGHVLDFVTDKSPLKIGRFTPGARLPVVSDVHLVREKCDYGLLLAWNFADEIIRNLDAFRRQGGRFIIPVPTPRVIS
jgi:SAM-dependent methyltransferase